MCLILDTLKYQYEIDHTHVYGWVRVINLWSYCTHHDRESSLQKVM